MTVRAAVEADTPRLVEMGCQFIATTRYAALMVTAPERLADVIALLLEQGGCWVLEAGPSQVVGMLGLALAPLPMTGELAALECMWWVEPESRRGRGGLALWQTGEAWAREQGAALIHMLQPVGEVALGELYRRRGYQPVETTWQKRLAA